MHSSLKFSRFKVPEENVVKREGETERDRERKQSFCNLHGNDEKEGVAQHLKQKGHTN